MKPINKKIEITPLLIETAPELLRFAISDATLNNTAESWRLVEISFGRVFKYHEMTELYDEYFAEENYKQEQLMEEARKLTRK